MTKDELLTEAKALDPQQRAELAEDLRQLVGNDELTDELRSELRRRAAALDRGDVSLIPGEQVMRELHERLRRR